MGSDEIVRILEVFILAIEESCLSHIVQLPYMNRTLASRMTYLFFAIDSTEEPRNSAFQGNSGFYALLREMPY